MKETVKINLSQRLFDLDIDAYTRLKEYLDSLKSILGNTPEEEEEILQDIEQRMADILSEKLKNSKQVVTLADIEEIISMMGTAEDFVRDGDFQNGKEPNEKEREDKKEPFSKEHRGFYRDIENNIIGGVCSGMGSYFNIDPVWLRIAFVLLIFFNGIGLIAYIVLWIAVPGARSTAQKLEMKGRPVTIDNIQQSVKDEINKVKGNFNKFSKSDTFNKSKHAISEVVSTLGEILGTLLKVVLILVGIGLVLAGITFIIGLITSFGTGHFLKNLHFPVSPFSDYMFPFSHSLGLFGLSVLVVLLIPVLAIFLGITRLIFNVRSRSRFLSVFAWTIWILALVFVVVSLLSGEQLFQYRHFSSGSTRLNMPSRKVLRVSLEEQDLFSRRTDHYTFFGKEVRWDRFNEKVFLKPAIIIRMSEDDEVYLILEHTATIPDFNREDWMFLHYGWHFDDTLLILNEYFSADEDQIWKIPGMNVILYVPEGQRIVLDKGLREMVRYQDNETKLPLRLFNDELIMQHDGLREISTPLKNSLAD